MSAANSNKGHVSAVLLALFVTFLWSTSWILIKIGLKAELPPITFAGIRYTLAFLCILPLVLFNSKHRQTIRELPKPKWMELIILGVVYYTLTQGAQYVGTLLCCPPPH
jgi:drug/metabolite transporter (DMT)-like permease